MAIQGAVVTTATPVGKQLMRSENAFTCEVGLDPSPASTLTTGDLGNGRSCLYSICAHLSAVFPQVGDMIRQVIGPGMELRSGSR